VPFAGVSLAARNFLERRYVPLPSMRCAPYLDSGGRDSIQKRDAKCLKQIFIRISMHLLVTKFKYLTVKAKAMNTDPIFTATYQVSLPTKK